MYSVHEFEEFTCLSDAGEEEQHESFLLSAADVEQ